MLSVITAHLISFVFVSQFIVFGLVTITLLQILKQDCLMAILDFFLIDTFKYLDLSCIYIT